MKHSLFQGLTTPNVMGMSPCLNMFLKTSIPAVSNGTSSMSIGERVQEIQSHKCVHLHQNHETWSNSWAHSSISKGDVTTLLHIYINFNPCCIQRYKFHVHRSYGSGDMIAQSYPYAPKPQNVVNFMGL